MSLAQVWRQLRPSAEARVVERLVLDTAAALDVPESARSAARRRVRIDPTVSADVRRGEPPMRMALVLLLEQLERDLVSGGMSSYRGRLAPAGRQAWTAWHRVAQRLVEDGGWTAQEYAEAAEMLREELGGVG